MTANWLARNRTRLWQIGVEHREALMAEYIALYRPTERPPVHMVYEELIGEFQGARIIDGPLRMDRFAQTEVVRGRPEITLNSLIDRMRGVKDVHGVRHVAAWHEGIHIRADVERRDLPPLTDLRSGVGGASLFREPGKRAPLEPARAGHRGRRARRCDRRRRPAPVRSLPEVPSTRRERRRHGPEWLAPVGMDLDSHWRQSHGSASVFRTARDLSTRRRCS
jgi:hypothetical protein